MNYGIEGLDDGLDKEQRHMPEVPRTACVNVCVDGVQMGLGCVTSWGAMPLDDFLVKYQDRTFTFVMEPVGNLF